MKTSKYRSIVVFLHIAGVLSSQQNLRALSTTDGSACTADNQCSSGFCSSLGICGGTPTGSFCSGDNLECFSRICTLGICRQLADGASCDIHPNCASGTCGGGICGEFMKCCMYYSPDVFEYELSHRLM